MNINFIKEYKSTFYFATHFRTILKKSYVAKVKNN